MDALKEIISSGSIVAWVILIVLLLVFIKLLKSAGKGLLLLAALIIVVLVIAKLFPGFAEPLIDFVRGGWLGDERPDTPW